MKKLLSVILCAALLLSFAPMCFASSVYGNATFRLDTDAADKYLERGDTVKVTTYLRTDYIVGSLSAIVFYDSTYFEPSIGGVPYTVVHSGNAGAITSGFITMIDNPDAIKTQNYNVWENGLVSGRVNNNLPVISYYPESWRESNTVLKAEYRNYNFVQVGVALAPNSPSSGYSVVASPEQAVFSFELRVKDNAPYTGDFTAKIFMDDAAVRSDATLYTKLQKTYATRLTENEYSATSTPDLYNMEYSLENANQGFRIVESGFTPPQEECTEHDWVGVVTTAPTFFRKGVMTYTCSVCADSYTEEIDSLLGQWFHSTWVYVNVIAPLVALFG